MTTNERNQDRTGQLSTHNIFNKQLSQWHCFCRRNWGLAWVVLGLVVAVAYRPLVFSSLCRHFRFECRHYADVLDKSGLTIHDDDFAIVRPILIKFGKMTYIDYIQPTDVEISNF